MAAAIMKMAVVLLVLAVSMVTALPMPSNHSYTGKSFARVKRGMSAAAAAGGPVATESSAPRKKRAVLWPSFFTDEQKRQALSDHQYMRKYMGAANMEYIYWDDTLADWAQEWADGCVWGHGQPDRNDARWSEEWLGQNVYYHTYGDDERQGIRAWFDEIENYDFETNGCLDIGEPCRHYTQITWAYTTHIGCAMSHCPALLDDGNTYDAFYLVCNYGPGGNVAGMHPYVEGEACTQCDGDKFWCFEGLCRDCDIEGITDQCTCADGCVHGTPDPVTCTCLTCDAGWTGPTCEDVCEEKSADCGQIRGWKKKHCTNSYIEFNCPVMCEVCQAGDGMPTSGPITHVVTLSDLALAEITSDSTTYNTINWSSGPYNPDDVTALVDSCHVRGVLHLTPPNYASAVELKFQVFAPTGWQFDIGDTNCHDGFGGSCAENGNDEFAEIHQHDHKLMAYRASSGKRYLKVDLESTEHSQVTIKLSRYYVHIEVDGDVKYSRCRGGTFLFNDFYIGVNRIIANFDGEETESDRVGSGLCSMDVTWLNAKFEECE